MGVPAGHGRTIKRAQDRFLEVLAQCGNVTQSCTAAGTVRQRVYEWREKDAEFATRWEDALDQAADVLEQEAFRRAVTGWDEPAISAGKWVHDDEGNLVMIRKYDANLLMLLLKAARPEKYRENIKVSGSLDHNLVPRGELWTLSQQIVDAVADLPDARAALSSRLLAGA